VLAVLILAASLDVTPTPAAPAAPAAQEIFHRTFARLGSYPLAPYTVWMDTWLTKRTDTRNGAQPVSTVSQRRYAVRIADGAENQTIYPVAGSALPPARVGMEFVGPFAFSLRRDQAHRGEPSSLQPDIPEPLKVIANVVAYPKPDYAIDSGAFETIAGHRVYHLRLHPLGNGRKHNLRDLWVDVDTFDLWKARFTSTYAPDRLLPESPTDATVWFTPVGAYWVASRVVWNWDDFQNAFAYDYDVSTERIAFPADLPDWLFDQRAYDRHVSAKDPDVLAPILAGPQPRSGFRAKTRESTRQ
jgi:hypothetical protein